MSSPAAGVATGVAALARFDDTYDARLRRLHDLIGGAPDDVEDPRDPVA
jgi:hypothetical protein